MVIKIKTNLLRRAGALFLLCGSASLLWAQTDAGYSSNWYLGFGVGLHQSSMHFSDLDSERFPTKKGRVSPLYSIFVQGEFGKEHNFVVRPELSWLIRGGRLTEIDRYDGYPEPRNNDDPYTKDINYNVKARYLDLRVPLLYQFGRATSGVRFYLGVTPILGFAMSGNIRLHEEMSDFSYNGYAVDLNKSNFATTYFAIAPTAGVRFNFRTGRQAQNVLFAAIEAGYEIGLTDTYGGDEKDGKAIDVVQGANYQFDGTRKFRGFEIQATLGIPFSAFRRSKAPAPVVAQPAYVPPVVVSTPLSKPEKPCYTLEEIIDMARSGKSVEGKTICAIDQINFDTNKSTLTADSRSYLDKIASLMLETNATVEVKGHTDNQGTDDYNMRLSRQRAEAVYKYLLTKGVSSDKLSYTYYGKTRPIESNDTEAGRRVNRRVEFEIK